MQEQFLLSGFGGQGVMFAGQLLAYTAMDQNLEVTWIPSYGPEMRGGTAHCYVIMSDNPIGSPIVKYPGVVIAFNNPSVEKYEPAVREGGLLAYNSSIVSYTPTRTDIDILPVPASDIASKMGGMRLLNMVMLGAVLSYKPVVSIEALRLGLENHIPPHRRNMLEMNYEAINKGAEFVMEVSAQ